MKKILGTAIVGSKDSEEFHKFLKSRIEEYQDANLEIEIQYQLAVDGTFTALIIGSKLV